MKGLAVDLIILNERGSSYVQDLQTSLEALVRTSQADRGTAPRQAERLPPARRSAVPRATATSCGAAARAVLLANRGTLSEQLVRQGPRPGPVPPRPSDAARAGRSPPRRPPSDLEFLNGLGGFAQDGREYVTALGAGQWTPAPWINVVANPAFGFQVSESGSGYTWSGNSRENKLTPWSNDPVCDAPGEAFYVRDEDSGLLWGRPRCPSARSLALRGPPRPGLHPLRAQLHGIPLTLLQFVPPETRSRSRACAWRTGRAAGGASPSRPTSSGCSGSRGAARSPRRDRDRPRHGGAVRPQPLERGVRGAGRLRRSARTPDLLDRDRTEFLGRNG